MFTCSVENAFGERVQLTNRESDYQILNIGGLNPPKVQLNRATIAGLDGSKFNSSRLEERNIVVTIKLNGDVEFNRLSIYKLFALKQAIKFYYKNERRDVYIEGRVESIECDYFTNAEVMQISIICPFPFFKDIDIIVDDLSKTMRHFSFPFSIEYNDPIQLSSIEIGRIIDVFNHGENECGIIIDVTFVGDVTELRILNTTTGESFAIYNPFIAGDHVVINTNKGEKSVLLTRNGVTTNLFSNVARGSSFFTLRQGDNNFSYLADDGEHDSNVMIVYKHYTLYGGV